MSITLKMIKDAMNAPPRTVEERDAEHEAWKAKLLALQEQDRGGKLRWDDDDNSWVFSSGRRAYAHDGMLGLSLEGDRVGYGADGSISYPPISWDGPSDFDLTADDMRELADMMIERWQRFRDSLRV